MFQITIYSKFVIYIKEFCSLIFAGSNGIIHIISNMMTNNQILPSVNLKTFLFPYLITNYLSFYNLINLYK